VTSASAPATTRREEAIGLLQDLIRADTVNPPGNESRAATILRDYLARDGIECEWIAREPERANVIARLPGGEGPSLAFLCHTDTVLADPAEWTRDPWSGDVVDGEIWGRGALDMKGQVAANAVAFSSLVREGFTPAGDLLFIASADEEFGEGDARGLSWLVETHPDAVRCDYAINEGGGERLVLSGQPVYICGTAEKASAPFLLRVHGRAGHASTPRVADNALVKAARYIEILGTLEPEPRLIPETTALLEALLGEVPQASEAFERASALDPALGELVSPLLGPTFSPTMIEASSKRNVIPAVCDLVVDCRLQPGQVPGDVEPILRAALGPGDYEIQWIEPTGGTRSELHSPLWDALESFVGGVEPGAKLVPIAQAGFTDSHYLREGFGTVAYGFFPLRSMDPELVATLIHAPDERVAVDDLELAVEMLRHAAREVLG
jgi:acetylornithine deacetylase/succinyl-diaminopimelate desuccinylase-like protein